MAMNKLSRHLKAAGLTRDGVAKKAGVSQPLVTAICHGTKTTLTSALAISAALDYEVPPHQIPLLPEHKTALRQLVSYYRDNPGIF